MRSAECGMSGWVSFVSTSPGDSAFRIPHSALSYGGAPPGIQVVLQQQRRGEGVDVSRAAAGLPAHFVDCLPNACRGQALVPQIGGPSRAVRDVGGQSAGRVGGVALVAVLVERQPDY